MTLILIPKKLKNKKNDFYFVLKKCSYINVRLKVITKNKHEIIIKINIRQTIENEQ